MSEQSKDPAVLTENERDDFVAQMIMRGTSFAGPLYQMVAMIERKVLERAADHSGPAIEAQGRHELKFVLNVLEDVRAVLPATTVHRITTAHAIDKVRSILAADAGAQGLTDEQILAIGRQHFRPGHDPKAEPAFVNAVRAVLCHAALPASGFPLTYSSSELRAAMCFDTPPCAGVAKPLSNQEDQA